MPFIKRIVKSDGLRAVLCWLGSWYIRLVFYSSRWTVVNGDIPDAYWQANRPFILTMWHGRFLMFPYAWPRNRRIHMLISRHRDGQIISRTVSHLGLSTIAGSSSRGGTQALRQMLNTLKSGEYIGITPDGPRGPRMHASDGVVGLAKLSGLPIIPIGINTSKRRVLGSWDRFLVSIPFSRGVFVWGAPIEVSRDADKRALEDARRQVEDHLTQVSHQADRYFDHEPVMPEVAGLTK